MSNPKGLVCNKEGGEEEEGTGTGSEESRAIFMEAVRRGSKRISYMVHEVQHESDGSNGGELGKDPCPPENPPMNPEERVSLWVK